MSSLIETLYGKYWLIPCFTNDTVKAQRVEDTCSRTHSWEHQSQNLIWCLPGHKKKWTSLVAQTVKRLSPMRETRVQVLGWEDALEKEMAIHCSTIAWKIPWTEEPGRLQSMRSQRVGHDWATSLSLLATKSKPSRVHNLCTLSEGKWMDS